jgi:hypothetical protein
VVFMTGHAGAEALAGAEVVLHKPIAVVDLARAVLRGLGRLAPIVKEPPQPPSDGLGDRVGTGPLGSVMRRWVSARWLAAGALPSPDLLDHEPWSAGTEECIFLVEVAAPSAGGHPDANAFRVLRAGTKATRLHGMPDADRSLRAAYQNCLRVGAPFYERRTVTIGGKAPIAAECLVAPLSADGVRVTHLVGAWEVEEPRSVH